MDGFMFNCPQCNQSIEAPDVMSGEWIACPACTQQIQVPPVVGESKLRLKQPDSKISQSQSPQAEKLIRTGAKFCPDCKKDIADDAVICVNCGLNLRSGEKIGTKKATLSCQTNSLSFFQECATSVLLPGISVIKAMKDTVFNRWFVGIFVLLTSVWFVQRQVQISNIKSEIESDLSAGGCVEIIPKNLPYVIDIALHGKGAFQKGAVKSLYQNEILLSNFDQAYWICPSVDRARIIDLLKEQSKERRLKVVDALSVTFRKESNQTAKSHILDIIEQFANDPLEAFTALCPCGVGGFETAMLNRIADLCLLDQEALVQAVHNRGAVNAANVKAAIDELDVKWSWSGTYNLNISKKSEDEPLTNYIFLCLKEKEGRVELSKKRLDVMLKNASGKAWFAKGHSVKGGIQFSLNDLDIGYTHVSDYTTEIKKTVTYLRFTNKQAVMELKNSGVDLLRFTPEQRDQLTGVMFTDVTGFTEKKINMIIEGACKNGNSASKVSKEIVVSSTRHCSVSGVGRKDLTQLLRLVSIACFNGKDSLFTLIPEGEGAGVCENGKNRFSYTIENEENDKIKAIFPWTDGMKQFAADCNREPRTLIFPLKRKESVAAEFMGGITILLQR